MKITGLDKQNFFNKSVKAMYEQGGPCKGHLNIGCMYHNPETGKKCIVGSVLTDDEHDSIPNTLNTVAITSVFANGVLTHLSPISDFLSSLQVAHDKSGNYEISSSAATAKWIPKKFALHLKSVALTYKLDDNVVNQTFGKNR